MAYQNYSGSLASPGTLTPAQQAAALASYQPGGVQAGGAPDFTALLNQLGPTILGGAGTILSGQQLQNSSNSAMNQASYKGTPIAGPGGSVVPTIGPNGQISYQLSGAGGGALGPLGQFASGAAGAANNALTNNPFAAPGANYLTAGNNALSALGQFDPNAYANKVYGQLASLQAPTNTNQTQQMLNYEQASGRGGLTQNGQLGDLGGLALSQSLGDTALRSQAEQQAIAQQAQLAQTASGLSATGGNLTMLGPQFANLYGAGAGGALSSVGGYNDSLMNMLRSAMAGSQGQAQAGANVARIGYDTGLARANQTGNFFGSTLQGLANSGGGLGSTLSGLGRFFTGANSQGAAQNYFDGFNGPTGYSNTGQTDQSVTPGLYNDQGFMDLSGSGSFNSAGGEAATGLGGTDTPGYGGEMAGGEFGIPMGTGTPDSYNFSNPGTPNADSMGYTGVSEPSGGGTFSGLSGALGTAGSALGIYNGLQRGGVSGYGGAALGAANLAKGYGAFGGNASAVGGGLGALGGALGVYNGIRQGGVAGYTGAALGAAQTYAGLSSALASSGATSGALAGAGAAGAIGAYAGPLAAFAALYGLDQKQAAMSPETIANTDQNNANAIRAMANNPNVSTKGFNGLSPAMLGNADTRTARGMAQANAARNAQAPITVQDLRNQMLATAQGWDQMGNYALQNNVWG